MTVKIRSWLTACLVPLALSLVACGYALVGKVSNIPEDIQTVYVESFENRTPRSQVEQIITAAISNEMVQRQRLEVVSSSSEADSILRGAVTNLRVSSIGFDDQGRANTYEVRLTLEVEFKRVTGEVIWSRDNYSFREDYEVEVTQAAFFSTDILALEQVSDEFAKTLVTDLFEGF